MKKALLVILAALMLPAAAPGRNPMEIVWQTIPDHVMPTIEANRRMDMCDLYMAGQKAEVKTRLGGIARLTAMGDTYVAVELSSNSTLHIKLVAHKADTFYVAINTVSAPAAYSRITFYNSSWQEMPAQRYITLPTIDDYILPTVSDSLRNEIVRSVLVPTVEYSVSDACDDIIATPTYDKTLDAATWQRIKPHLYTHRTLRREGKKWRLSVPGEE